MSELIQREQVKRFIRIVQRTYPLVFFPLTETDLTETVARNYGTLAGADGEHTNVLLKSLRAPGNTWAPYYSGTLARTKIYSVPISTGFAPAAIYSVFMCYCIYDPDEWSDGVLRYILNIGSGSGTQYIRVYKDNVSPGKLIIRASTIYSYVNAPVGWHSFLITNNIAGNLRVYHDNVQIYAGAGRGWTLPMNNFNSCICANAWNTGASSFHGYGAHLIMWNREISTYERTYIHNQAMSVGSLSGSVDFHGAPSLIYVSP